MKRAGIQTYSAEALTALQHFLSHVALPEKRARYLDLISRPNSRRKFLDTLHHELGTHLDPVKTVTKLTADQLALPGFRFHHGTVFGEAIDTLAAACTPFDENFLVISTDGNIGIHGPDSIDGRTYYIA